MIEFPFIRKNVFFANPKDRIMVASRSPIGATASEQAPPRRGIDSATGPHLSLSVGIEDEGDLIADLEQALDSG